MILKMTTTIIIENEATNICENCRDQEAEIEMLKRRISEMDVESRKGKYRNKNI